MMKIKIIRLLEINGALIGEKKVMRVARGKGVCRVNTYVDSVQLKF